MPTIKYDKPVKNLIAGLNATGHVTHTSHRKTKVTVHHNAGRLSHEGVLNVWKTRPASAHFDVDGTGAVAQYVNVNEYAWATGTTNGNQQSISIEMANSKLAPTWEVAEATWKNVARLAGWLFAKVIGARPTRDNFVAHKYWKSTVCAGPFIDKVYPRMLQLAQQTYDQFTKGPAPKPVTKPVTKPSTKKPLATVVQEVLNGVWGNGPERRRRLTAAGYNAAEVQRLVNLRLGGGAPAASKPSVSEVASEVIAGEWGNGAERRRRLEGAGYNYKVVQDEVNRRLRR